MIYWKFPFDDLNNLWVNRREKEVCDVTFMQLSVGGVFSGEVLLQAHQHPHSIVFVSE